MMSKALPADAELRARVPARWASRRSAARWTRAKCVPLHAARLPALLSLPCFKLLFALPATGPKGPKSASASAQFRRPVSSSGFAAAAARCQSERPTAVTARPARCAQVSDMLDRLFHRLDTLALAHGIYKAFFLCTVRSIRCCLSTVCLEETVLGVLDL